jgi:AmmeMemoRadiSam system protein B
VASPLRRIAACPAAGLAVALACLLELISAAAALGADASDNRFLAAAQDGALVARALERGRQERPPSVRVTGVTVPHHLLAADLIARGVLAASARTYERVLILSPDHFRALETPFGITTANLETATGTLVADRPFSQAVLSASSLFADIGSASREHGIHAVTPFIRAVFPQARIVAITTATHGTPADWRAAVELLGSLLGAETLIVQSTDYSHFLPVATAALRDQETLAALASGDPEAVLALDQPAHLDSLASQFIQMSLQRRIHAAAPVIIANRSSHEYGRESGDAATFHAADPTTSYVVTVFTPEPEQGWQFRYPDQMVIYFGGDTYVGRGWTEAATRPGAVDRLVRRIKHFTGDHPLVINLEGVVLEEQPAGANRAQHLMLARLAIPVLRKLGVAAANLANNHAYDFGEEGLEQTAALLEAAGIRALRHGAPNDLGPLTLLPLTFKRGYFLDHPVIRDVSQLASICALQGGTPLVVLAHWGADYTDVPGPFEVEVLDRLATCGVSAVIGAHSHRASTKVELRSGGALQSVFSMGNLIFDQSGPHVSGALVELRIFRQGTIALRTIAIPNFFAMPK